MGITILWDDEAQTRLRLDLKGSWTWDQYDTAIFQANTLLQNVRYPVHLIHNQLEGSRLPLGYFLPHFQTALELLEPHLGLIVIVGSNYSTQVLLSLFIETFTKASHKTAFAKSIDEARTMLAKQHATVSNTR